MSYPQHNASQRPQYQQPYAQPANQQPNNYQQRPQSYQQQPQHHASYQQPPQHQGSYQQQPQPHYQHPQRNQSQQHAGQPPQRADTWTQQLYSQASQQQVHQLQQWFQTVDRDRSGTIETQELQEVTFGGVKLGWECAASLLKVFDKDRNGSIDFNEYVALHQFILIMRSAFLKSDADRSGRIEAKEIHQALNLGGFTFVSLDTILELLLRFDKSRTGLSWTDFLMLAAHIAHARAMFRYNDHDKSGWITININQFIQLMSYIT